MAIQITAPLSTYVDRTKTIAVTWSNTDSIYNGHQTSYEIQYRLPSSSSWSTLGTVTSSTASATLNGIFDAVGEDAEEYYYRIVVKYTNFDAKSTSLGGMTSGTDYSDVYSIAFHGSQIGTMKIYDGSNTNSYPIYDTVQGSKAKINANITSAKRGAAPIVDTNSPFASKSRVIVNSETKNIAASSPTVNFYSRRGNASGYFTVYKYQYTTNYAYDRRYANYAYDRSYANYARDRSYANYAYDRGYNYISGSRDYSYNYIKRYFTRWHNGGTYSQAGYTPTGSDHATDPGCGWYAYFGDEYYISGYYYTYYRYSSQRSDRYRTSYRVYYSQQYYYYYYAYRYQYAYYYRYGLTGGRTGYSAGYNYRTYNGWYAYTNHYYYYYSYASYYYYYTTYYYTSRRTTYDSYMYRIGSYRYYVGYAEYGTTSGSYDTYSYTYYNYIRSYTYYNYIRSYTYYNYIRSYTYYNYIRSYTYYSYIRSYTYYNYIRSYTYYKYIHSYTDNSYNYNYYR